ncbi:hypothetical protein PENSPDRAFT_740177 [Peniophora sp. CONT]|nr:hypothetical protein PENSPDRAFT_740177 [Peniophora sp. CONT]
MPDESSMDAGLSEEVDDVLGAEVVTKAVEDGADRGQDRGHQGVGVQHRIACRVDLEVYMLEPNPELRDDSRIQWKLKCFAKCGGTSPIALHFDTPPKNAAKKYAGSKLTTPEGDKPDWLRIGFNQLNTRHVLGIEVRAYMLASLKRKELGDLKFEACRFGRAQRRLFPKSFEKVADIELSADSIRSDTHNTHNTTLNGLQDECAFRLGDAVHIFEAVPAFLPDKTALFTGPPRTGCAQSFIVRCLYLERGRSFMDVGRILDGRMKRKGEGGEGEGKEGK